MTCEKTGCEEYARIGLEGARLFGGITAHLCKAHDREWDTSEALRGLCLSASVAAARGAYIRQSASGQAPLPIRDLELEVSRQAGFEAEARAIAIKWLDCTDSLEAVTALTR